MQEFTDEDIVSETENIEDIEEDETAPISNETIIKNNTNNISQYEQNLILPGKTFRIENKLLNPEEIKKRKLTIIKE